VGRLAGWVLGGLMWCVALDDFRDVVVRLCVSLRVSVGWRVFVGVDAMCVGGLVGVFVGGGCFVLFWSFLCW